jgi:ribosome biogenesis protein ENP2
MIIKIIYVFALIQLKVWDGSTGKQKVFIESTSNFNDFCTIPNSGLFFFAQEEVKMQTNYVPSLGPAPKWCSFLDKLTEEIEVETTQNVYDDYKFVTRKELEELNLDHLEGSDLLKAYMHGFFIDMKLYMKAKADVREPYMKPKKTIEKTETERLQVKDSLPKVNKKMALQMLSSKEALKNPDKPITSIVDDRFKQMFENEDFQIDEQSEDYRRTFKPTKPADDEIKKKPKRKDLSDESEEEYIQEMAKKRESLPSKKFKIAPTETVTTKVESKKSLMKRLETESKNLHEISTISGNRQMVFNSASDSIREQRREKKKHHDERKKSIRSANFKKFK